MRHRVNERGGRRHRAMRPVRRERPGNPTRLVVTEVRIVTGASGRPRAVTLEVNVRRTFSAVAQAGWTVMPLAMGPAAARNACHHSAATRTARTTRAHYRGCLRGRRQPDHDGAARTYHSNDAQTHDRPSLVESCRGSRLTGCGHALAGITGASCRPCLWAGCRHPFRRPCHHPCRRPSRRPPRHPPLHAHRIAGSSRNSS